MIATKRSLTYSALAHLVGVLVVVFGFPSMLDRPEPEPFVMSVEVVPISAMTNLPSRNAPLTKKQEAPAPKTPKPITPTVKEERKPEPAPEEKKDDVPLPEPEKTAEKKEDKKDPPKKETKKTKEQDEFEAVLKSLKEQANKTPEKDAKDKKTAEENKTRSDKPYDPTLPLSITEKDAIRGQFVKCWRMPAGAKEAENLATRVRVKVSQSGEVTEVRLVTSDIARYQTDSFFRAAADSAIRAVWKCSPLQNLPPEKYETWRDMELNFDPQELLY